METTILLKRIRVLYRANIGLYKENGNYYISNEYRGLVLLQHQPGMRMDLSQCWSDGISYMYDTRNKQKM